jgi:hypothetical protein
MARAAIDQAAALGLGPLKQNRQPVSVLSYGPMKTGKSVDLGYAFPAAINIARPDALESVRSVCGYNPTVVSLARLGLVNEFLWGVAAEIKRRNAIIQAVIVDDFSQLMQSEVGLLGVEQENHPDPKQRNNNFAKFDKAGLLMQGFHDASRALLELGVFVVANAHEGEPKTNMKGKFIPGGPAFPGQLQGSAGGYFSMLLRVSTSDRPRPRWRFSYDNDPGAGGFVTGDRLDVAYPDAPLNLGELLRAAGYSIPRIKGLEWGEAVAGQISDALKKLPPVVAGQPDAAAAERSAVITTAFTQLRTKGAPRQHIDWVLRDAYDRATIALDNERRFERSWLDFSTANTGSAGW